MPACWKTPRYEPAEEAFAALKHTFYDWNEVRVTSISELSEVMAVLPDPRAAANRIKRVLHSIFEELYCFDLEDKRKKNLGPTVKWLEKMDGTSRFVVAYVVQAALGGHSIPVDAGTLAALRVLELVSEKEAATGEVPGLERAVSKSKGVEFGSLLHQLGADYLANPFSPQVREVLLAIDPEASKRFPQRRQPRASRAGPGRAAGRRAPAPPPPAATGRKRRRNLLPKPAVTEPKTADGKAAESKADQGGQAGGNQAGRNASRRKASRRKARRPKPSRRKANRSKPRRRLLPRARKRRKPRTNRGPQRSSTRNRTRSGTREKPEKQPERPARQAFQV